MNAKPIGVLLILMSLTAATHSDSPVADAAMKGETESVRSLVRSGADVNAAQGDGMTALHWAAELDAVEMAEILVFAGANLEATTRLGAFTPLLVGSRSGAAGVVTKLLAAGADVNATTTTGETGLHLAANAGSAETTRALLGHGADVDAREDAKAQTPLMFAAAFDRVDVVRGLLDGGADPSLQTLIVDYPAIAEEDRALARLRSERLSFLYGEDVAIQQLVDGTVQEDDEEEPEDEAEPAEPSESEPAGDEREEPGEESGAVDEREEPGEESGAVDEREEPREESGAVDEREDAPSEDAPGGVEEEVRRPFSYDQLVGVQGGNTALHYAAREGHGAIAELLLDRGAELNHRTAGDRSSPLLIATLNGHFDLATWLLERGADPNLASSQGATPLYVAIHLQWVPKSFYPQPTAIKQELTTYLELSRALLEAGADPDARLERHLWYTSFNHNVLGVDTWGATPFWRAAWGTDVEAMQLLIAYGADPTIPTRRPPGRVSTGSSPEEESEADQSGLPEVEVGGPGVYPIHAASGVGYGLGLAGNAHRHAPDGWLPSMKYLIEQLGTDVNARDYNGLSPLHNAAARGDTELIHYLVAMGGDVTLLTRKGQTTADMANGPVQRVTVFPAVVALLESLGSANNHNCVSCQ